jgi:hypothetical protein
MENKIGFGYITQEQRYNKSGDWKSKRW